MDFRLLQESALSQAADLWDYCFEKKGTPFYEWYFREYALKQNRILGGFQDGKLRTMLHLNPYVLRVRGRDWKVPYIVGVATDPVARGHHVMGQLMDTAFTMLRAMKVPFVILNPFTPASTSPTVMPGPISGSITPCPWPDWTWQAVPWTVMSRNGWIPPKPGTWWLRSTPEAWNGTTDMRYGISGCGTISSSQPPRKILRR